MRRVWRAAYGVGIVLVVAALWGPEVNALGTAVGPRDLHRGRAAAPGQIPNLLQRFVEGVLRAFEELRDSLREQLCGRCPAAGMLVLCSAIAAGCARLQGRG